MKLKSRQLLIKAARVAADAISPSRIRDIECYPQYRLLFEILPELGFDVEEVKEGLLCDNWIEVRSLLRDRLEEMLKEEDG